MRAKHRRRRIIEPATGIRAALSAPRRSLQTLYGLKREYRPKPPAFAVQISAMRADTAASRIGAARSAPEESRRS